MDGPSLPRSVRWRLQLGLLALPSTTEEEQELSLKDLYDYNASLLQDQRNRFNDLREEHAEALEAFVAEEQQHDDNDETSATASPPPTTTASLDPLTAMLQEKEAQEERRRELELKYRKERARRNRGISNDSPTNSSNTDAVCMRSNFCLCEVASSASYLRPHFPYTLSTVACIIRSH